MDWNFVDWHRRYQAGFHHLRVHAGMYEAHIDDAISRGYKTGDTIPGTNDLLTVGPFKMITDGGLGSQTAYCHEPYPGTHDHGIFPYAQSTLAEMIHKGTSHQFRMAIHAIGDEANKIVLQTLADSLIPPLPGTTIEHAQLLDFADIPYFVKLGLIASVQPAHLVDDRETCLKYWPGREGRAWALKTLGDAGVGMKFGSDSPVTDLNPWEAMAVAISRAGQGKAALSVEQSVGLDIAWKSSTSVSSSLPVHGYD
jgi:predicted amidohydrolase YtcJ